MEHQNRHANSVIVLSYKQSRYLNAHVHKLQHSAQSRLFNDLFPPRGSPGPPSMCSLEAVEEEGEYEACRSTRRLYLILIERWPLGVAMQLRPVESNRVCSQKIQKELRFVDIPQRHSLNPCRDQKLEEDR